LLERTNHPDKIYVGHIVPMQLASCKKASEMKNCIGVGLGTQGGICAVKVTFEEKVHDFKLFVDPSTDGKSIIISGLVPNAVMDHYYNFGEIIIVNEKTEKKFFINKKAMSGYGTVDESFFKLYPDIALGNTLRIYIPAFGERFLLGDCSIGLRNPGYNETQIILDTIAIQTHEKTSNARKQIIVFLATCVCILSAIFFIIYLSKKYKKVKQETFEVVMTARKERYADAAIAVNTARGLSSARGPPALSSNRGFGTFRDASSARLGMISGKNKDLERERERESTPPKKHRQPSRAHVELAEHEEDEDYYN